MHIPKTAGSTFTDVLKRQYFRRGRFEFSGDIAADIERYNRLHEADKDRIGIFYGHAPIATGLDGADDAVIITFLRHPVSRVKSFCQHVSEGKSPQLVDTYPPRSFSLDRFLDSGNEELSNLQTKMLINEGTCESPDIIGSMTETEAVDLAMGNLLNRVTCFGLQEYFDESLLLFKWALNWRIPIYTSRNKKSRDRTIRFESRHITLIEEMNAADLSLYDAAKAQFQKCLQGEEGMSSSLWRFQRLNRIGSMVLKMMYWLGRKRI